MEVKFYLKIKYIKKNKEPSNLSTENTPKQKQAHKTHYKYSVLLSKQTKKSLGKWYKIWDYNINQHRKISEKNLAEVRKALEVKEKSILETKIRLEGTQEQINTADNALKEIEDET